MITSSGPDRAPPGARPSDTAPPGTTRRGGRAREQAEILFTVARRLAGAEDRDQRELVRDLAELSAGFTRERGQRASGYMNEARRRRAYLAWFTPMNALRVAALVDRLLQEGLLTSEHLTSVGDLGAGPLSASIGAALVASGPVEMTATDRSKRALDDGVELLRALADEGVIDVGRIATGVADLRKTPAPLGPGAHALVIAANVLNELADARRGSGLRESVVRGAIQALAPGGRLLIVEPAGRVPTRALMRLRDELASSDELRVLSPCPAVGRCPLLMRRGDWCHQEVAHALPSSALKLAREAGLAAEKLQLSHLLVARAGEADGRVAAHRLVGGVMGRGAEQRRYACTADGLVALRARGDGFTDEVRLPLRGMRLDRLPKTVSVEAPDRARPGGPPRSGPQAKRQAPSGGRGGGGRGGGGRGGNKRRGPRKPKRGR